MRFAAVPAILLFLVMAPRPAAAQVKVGDSAILHDFGQRDLFEPEKEYWISNFVGPEAWPKQRKKALLLSFCASYCEACWEELPRLLQWKEEYGRRGFEIWEVVVDQEPEGRRKAKQKMQRARGKIVITRMAVRKMADTYMGKPWTMPALYLIDRHGRVVSILRGLEKGGLKRLKKNLEQLLPSDK